MAIPPFLEPLDLTGKTLTESRDVLLTHSFSRFGALRVVLRRRRCTCGNTQSFGGQIRLDLCDQIFERFSCLGYEFSPAFEAEDARLQDGSSNRTRCWQQKGSYGCHPNSDRGAARHIAFPEIIDLRHARTMVSAV